MVWIVFRNMDREHGKKELELAKTRTLLAVSSTGLLGQGYDCETPFHEGSQTASFQISPEIPLPR